MAFRRTTRGRSSGAGGSEARSTAETFASLLVNAQALLAKEVELLGLELRRIVVRKLAALGTVLVLALMAAATLVLGAVSVAIWLESRFDAAWQAWAAVTGGLLLVCLLLTVLVLRLLGGAWTPMRTRRQLDTTVAWLRSLGEDARDAGDDRPGGERT
jgi:hypothetical protein